MPGIFQAIIHMNGRIYDPRLGRMLSPDPVTQAREDGQNYNRYTYASNNPLKYTDPSGFCIGEIGENGFSTDGWLPCPAPYPDNNVNDNGPIIISPSTLPADKLSLGDPVGLFDVVGFNAFLSAWSYGAQSGDTIYGWTVSTIWTSSESGLKVVVFTHDGATTVAFVGTEVDPIDWQDVRTDIGAYFARITPQQYTEAFFLGALIGASSQNVTFIGHSLGGALASVAAGAAVEYGAAVGSGYSNANAYIYNSSGLSNERVQYLNSYNLLSLAEAAYIVHTHANNDPLQFANIYIAGKHVPADVTNVVSSNSGHRISELCLSLAACKRISK